MGFGSENLDTKRFTDEMLDWVRGRGKILIVIHDNPDPDCLASAIALRHLFVMKVNREATIAFSGMISRSENLAMAKELEIPLTPIGFINFREFSVVCMLDTQPGTGNNSLPADRSVDILVDHHPMRETSKKCRWVDIREDYGVTATILYEYLVTQGVYLGTKLATALFYAIKSETQDLGREANKPDRDAYLKLFTLSNKKLLYEITHPKLPVEYFLMVNRALENTKIYGKLLITNLAQMNFPEMVAEMADFFLRLEGIELVLAMGQYGDGMLLSLRTIRHDLNAGILIGVLVEGRGNAGGHGMMAGGKIENVPASPEAIHEAEDFLANRLLTELNIIDIKPQTLQGLREKRNFDEPKREV
ncbi:DHH family phosphoesterase [Geobacter hydrogenophilus]|uniref:DHH family phosphoesterase n=1 Tax=Geobacter hydrogenophilus TaxID=40983 RepID=A0A9W6G188_9BACT|nr:DHH family phosphoesterase [Geobacter hydrogenophilus]MBT0893180.1 DHH family phosphoesterase [Geobacter hydrogenophilus]GLI38975.1 DHH family phosphoesterase [Geobacter hydrogenophilus]